MNKAKMVAYGLFFVVAMVLGYLAYKAPQAPQERGLYAPNLMNRIPSNIPCPPFCNAELQRIVDANDDTGLKITKSGRPPMLY